MSNIVLMSNGFVISNIVLMSNGFVTEHEFVREYGFEHNHGKKAHNKRCSGLGLSAH